jgi:hypothetical protein
MRFATGSEPIFAEPRRRRVAAPTSLVLPTRLIGLPFVLNGTRRKYPTP